MGSEPRSVSSQMDRHPHLSDDALMESYLLALENPHLRECSGCTARFDELAAVAEGFREDAVREADGVFTNERLHDQRDRILRRLERQGVPAELLMFPTRPHHAEVRRAAGPARRWVAGAAAAGLAAGVFLGFAVDRRVISSAANHAPQIQTISIAQDDQDERILIEIEDALMAPRRVLELQALDAMTTPAELQEASFDIR